MKKNIFVGSMATMMVAGIMNMAGADYLLSPDRISELANEGYGVYLGSYPNNDNNFELIETQINGSEYYTGGDIDLSFYAKVDNPSSIDEQNLMEVNYDQGNLTGSWSTKEPIDFYTVKAAKGYSIWWIEGGAMSGIWTTEGLINNGGNQPAISHLSGFINELAGNPDPPTNVPEPATVTLLSLALFGLGLIRRKK